MIRLWARFEDFANKPHFYKAACICIVFTVEDMPEMVLEYFFVERYAQTARIPWFLVLRNCVLILISFYGGIDLALKGKNSFFVIIAMTSVAHALRVVGSMIHPMKGTLSEHCFSVEDGKLYQTPFNLSCMHGIDYAILIFLYLPYACVLLSLMCCCVTCCFPESESLKCCLGNVIFNCSDEDCQGFQDTLESAKKRPGDAEITLGQLLWSIHPC